MPPLQPVQPVAIPSVIFLQADEWLPVKGRQPPTIAAIINVVSWHYEVSRAAMISPSVRSRVTFPRHIAMFLIRRLVKLSFPALGNIFHRDHTTIISAVRKIERLSIDDQTVRADLAAIEKALAA